MRTATVLGCLTMAGGLWLAACAAPAKQGMRTGAVPGAEHHPLPTSVPSLPRGGADRMRLGVAPSFLPNLGLQLSAEWPLRRTEAGLWHLEAQAVDQFLDDETFSNDGNPAAGNWTQLALALRLVRSPDAEQSAEFFAGPVHFHARGKPNLVERPGTYFGLRAGAGYLVHLTPNLVLGPEFALVIAHGNRADVVFPQIAWGVRWSPGRRHAPR